MGKLFLTIRDEYTKQLAQRRTDSNRELINRWVHDPEAKPDTRNDPEA
jgi:hypothetical protein